MCTIVSAQNKLSTVPSSFYFKSDIKVEKEVIFADSVRHKTLYAALKATRLDDLMRNSGSFTIFAPSENAFSQFTAEELKDLFESDNLKKLSYLMSSHIVPGKLTASKILKAMCKGGGRAVFTTIQGNKLTARMDGLDIVLIDSLGHRTKITKADFKNDATVIHEIDSVMVASIP
ncbi:fasciclin domain-containing protein [Croceivirga thetidis]|uniref:fasciclin domain-containing protein n=1 Tax=Croceivirga thetidis TaxID=2721623 RepID=UPI001B2FEE76|nr:fasciclin domain-containing protein [Croceivirga thetidis]